MNQNKTYRREDLEVLSSQELDIIVRAEIEKDSMDDWLILQILDILEKREADMPAEVSVDVDAAWRAFQTDYATNPKMLKFTPKASSKKRNLVRLIGAVAAVVAVFCVVTFTAPTVSGEENIFEIFGRWTESIFEFFHPTKPDAGESAYVFRTDNPGLQQIYDEVAKLGVTQPVVPMWLPEGYELSQCQVYTLPTYTMVYADFAKDSNYISVAIKRYDDKKSTQYSKDDGNAEIYEWADIEHYIISNENTWVTAWVVSNIECSVTVDCSKEILYDIIKSVYMEVS